jgi:hypothetical protein
MGRGNLNKQDTYMSEMPKQNPLRLSIHTLKISEGQEGKISLFRGE